MKAAKLTPWFAAGTVPARPGVYRVRAHSPRIVRFQYWNGKFWGLRSAVPDVAARRLSRESRSAFDAPEWRGLTAEAKVAA